MLPDEGQPMSDRRDEPLNRRAIDLERERLAVEFAKYGFAGTLTAAAIGAAVILGLAVLSAFTPFKIDTWGLVAMAAITLIGTVAFGYLSLWELPRIVAKFQGTTFAVYPDRVDHKDSRT
jgi:ABC-type antimicrobial peptide transport system permease subunit